MSVLSLSFEVIHLIMCLKCNGWVKWGTSIKEGTFQDEHWVSYVRDESLGSTPKAKTTLYIK